MKLDPHALCEAIYTHIIQQRSHTSISSASGHYQSSLATTLGQKINTANI